MNYCQEVKDKDDCMTVKQFLSCVREGGFTYYDGVGMYARTENDEILKTDFGDHFRVPKNPSDLEVPESATHVVWSNR